eukprot:TRINITY_DN3904_c1_g1_i3.p3 TRINITY_DN3904_c1_g1~~TRINITY_DN3904_c1_g1_i3.p3  ORF type:complete len:208 (-),score=38.18 TRINITY_DN3904_c1_g1_i3:201-824(-)
MQAITTPKLSFASSAAKTVVRSPTGRTSLVVRASQEASRRSAIGGVVAGVVGLAANAAFALSAVDLIDDRKAIQKGFDIIYEARDLDLPQNVRDGITQMKSSLEATKARAVESSKRIQTEVAQNIEKKYWTSASNALRNQVGTLRFDLNTLAAAKESKADRQAANQAAKEFFAQVENLDLALKEKNQDKINKAYASVIQSLNQVFSA